MARETPVPLPVVREQELYTSVAETQRAANTKKEEGKESSLLGTRPLPSPRSFKPLTSTPLQPEPQTCTHKESIKQSMSDEGERELCFFFFKPVKHVLCDLGMQRMISQPKVIIFQMILETQTGTQTTRSVLQR